MRRRSIDRPFCCFDVFYVYVYTYFSSTLSHANFSLKISFFLAFSIQLHVTCLLWTVLKSYLALSHLLPVEGDIAPSFIKALRQNQPLMWEVSSIHYSFRTFLQFLWLKFKSEMGKFFSLIKSEFFPHEGGTAERLSCCGARIEFWLFFANLGIRQIFFDDLKIWRIFFAVLRIR